MIWRGGFVKLGLMATDALSRKSEAIELSDGSDLVTRITVHRGVSTNQRKSILVRIDVVN
jgi:hypothetical protein